MNDEMAAVRQTEQSGGNEASMCNRNKEWQDILLYIFGYHNLFLLPYIQPAYFFSSYKVSDVSIPLYSDQTRGTLICESKSWLDRSARDHVGFRFGSCIDLLYKREQYLVDRSSFVF